MPAIEIVRRGAYLPRVGGGETAIATHDDRDAFWRNDDGSWICIDPITIEHPKGRVQVSPGTTIKPGVPFMGVDLATWLDEQRVSDPNL